MSDKELPNQINQVLEEMSFGDLGMSLRVGNSRTERAIKIHEFVENCNNSITVRLPNDTPDENFRAIFDSLVSAMAEIMGSEKQALVRLSKKSDRGMWRIVVQQLVGGEVTL